MKRVIFLLSGIVISLYSQSFPRPVSANITSDFGPRNLGGYDWHPAIDYGSPMWTPVKAVEKGNIIQIDWQKGKAGWYIRVDGDSATWTYMHLFDNQKPCLSPDNKWEAVLADLEDSTTHSIDQSYIFIIWEDRANNKAQRVLAPEKFENRWIRWNNNYILNADGTKRIKTQGSVAQGDVIAPSGQSGSAYGHPHLDIRASSSENGKPYDINPLYYIKHNQPNYTVSILYPSVNSIIYHRPGAPEAQQLNECIRVNVNSSVGVDLDRVFISLNPVSKRFLMRIIYMQKYCMVVHHLTDHILFIILSG